MKTIGVDIRVLATGRVSGIEEYTEQLLSHMTALQSGVQWKLFYRGRVPLQRRAWMEHSSISIHEVHSSNRLLWLSTRAIGRPFLDEVVGGADAFFFPHFLLGALSSRCRRVMTWHDLSYERMPYLLSPYRRFWHAVQMRPRQQAQAADRIVAVSESTAADLVDLYGIDRSRLAVVYSGIDPALRRAGDEAVEKWRLARGIQAPFILALGTREPRKNLPALVHAWDIARRQQSVHNTHLVLAGQSGWKEGELRRALASVHAPQDIHVIDNVERHERRVLLSAASALVYPSLMEGFGFPPLEAMACGTPVIASATSSLIETVGDAGVLVNPYRVDEMVAAIRSVVTDAGLRSRLIARGYEQSHRFSWQRAAEQTFAEISAVL